MAENELMPITPQGMLATADPAAVAAAETARARIQSAYLVALQKPRNEDQARVKILEACKRPMFAERVEYSKPVGGRSIKGPSVRFAELALREWGNVLTESQVIFEDLESRRVRVTVIDLETNATFSKELSIRKTVERKDAKDREVLNKRLNTKNEIVYIVLATEDELMNKENAMISKAIRNEGLRAIPSDVIDEALEIARDTLRNRDAQDPKAAKKRIVDGFTTLGIYPKDLANFLGHSLDSVTPAELEGLRGVYTSLREGETTWADHVKEPEKEQEPDKAEKKKSTATEKLAEKTAKKDKEPQGSTDGFIPASPEVIADILMYCKALELNPDDVAQEMRADKQRGLGHINQEDADKILKSLLDQFSAKTK